jgi:ferredoxin-NADP reductase
MISYLTAFKSVQNQPKPVLSNLVTCNNRHFLINLKKKNSLLTSILAYFNAHLSFFFSGGRLSSADIKRNIENVDLDISKTHCFLCGPGPMINDMENALNESGISKDRIYYEKWW